MKNLDRIKILENNLKKLKKLVKEAEADGDRASILRAISQMNEIAKILQKEEHPEIDKNQQITIEVIGSPENVKNDIENI